MSDLSRRDGCVARLYFFSFFFLILDSFSPLFSELASKVVSPHRNASSVFSFSKFIFIEMSQLHRFFFFFFLDSFSPLSPI